MAVTTLLAGWLELSEDCEDSDVLVDCEDSEDWVDWVLSEELLWVVSEDVIMIGLVDTDEEGPVCFDDSEEESPVSWELEDELGCWAQPQDAKSAATDKPNKVLVIFFMKNSFDLPIN